MLLMRMFCLEISCELNNKVILSGFIVETGLWRPRGPPSGSLGSSYSRKGAQEGPFPPKKIDFIQTIQWNPCLRIMLFKIFSCVVHLFFKLLPWLYQCLEEAILTHSFPWMHNNKNIYPSCHWSMVGSFFQTLLPNCDCYFTKICFVVISWIAGVLLVLTGMYRLTFNVIFFE